MRRIWLAWILAIVSFAVWVLPAAAQGGQAPALTGQVTGLEGRPLAGVEAEVFRFGAGRVASVMTDQAGYFRYQIPDEGAVYWVRTWAKGYHVAEASWTAGQGSPFIALPLDPMDTELTIRAVDPQTGSGVNGARFEVRRNGIGRVALLDGDDSGVARTRIVGGEGFSVLAWAPGRIPVEQTLGEARAGAARNVTLKMQASMGLIKGVVVSQSGAPLKGVSVRVVRKGSGVVSTTQTDNKGNFGASVLSGSDYQVLAELDGYTVVETNLFTLKPGATQDLSGDQQLVLHPATASISGRLRDPDGLPLAGRAIWLYRKSVGAIANTTTDRDGKFAFQGLPAQTGIEYLVQALPGDASWRAASSPWLQLAVGQTVATALRLQRGTLGNRSPNGAIIGTVTDEWGLAVPGVDIQLWREGNGFVQSTTSGADGSFSFTNVGANGGTYGWEVPYNGYFLKANAPGMREEVSAAEGLIDVLPGKDTVVSLAMHHRWLSLSGLVIGDDGVPLADSEVVLTPPSGTPLTVSSDSDGRWLVEQTDPLIDYTLSASHPGYQESVLPGSIHSGPDSSHTTVQLHAANARISGYISDPTGKPLASIPLEAWSPAGAYQATTGSNGRYAVDVPAGVPYVVSVASGDGAMVSDLVPSPAASQTNSVLALTGGEWYDASFELAAANGSIAGTVLGSDGQPARETAVELLREGESVVTSTVTDSQGRYRFENVPANVRYEVRPKGAGYSYVGSGLPRLFMVMPGTTSNVHVQLTPHH